MKQQWRGDERCHCEEVGSLKSDRLKSCHPSLTHSTRFTTQGDYFYLYAETTTKSPPIGGSKQNAAHSTWKMQQTFCMSLMSILRRTVAELFDDSYIGLTCLMAYSVTFCCLPEVASDVMSGRFVRQIIVANAVKFGYSKLQVLQIFDSRSSEVGFCRVGLCIFRRQV